MGILSFDNRHGVAVAVLMAVSSTALNPFLSFAEETAMSERLAQRQARVEE